MNEPGEKTLMGTAEDHDLLITLNAKLDSILEAIKQIPDLTKRVGDLEKGAATRCEQIETLEGEVGRLRAQNTFWSSFNTIAVIIGTTLGIKL